MPGLARELPTEFAGDTAGRLWLRSAAFRLSFSPLRPLSPFTITTFPFSDSAVSYIHTTVAATLHGRAEESVVSSTLQVHLYRVSLKKRWKAMEKKKEQKVKGIAVGRMDKLFLFLRSMVKLARMGNF